MMDLNIQIYFKLQNDKHFEMHTMKYTNQITNHQNQGKSHQPKLPVSNPSIALRR